MNPDTQETIDAGDGVVVDMARYNIGPIRDRYIEETDMGMLELMQRQLDLTFDEALTKSLYHACRCAVRDRNGHFGWIEDIAEALEEADDGS